MAPAPPPQINNLLLEILAALQRVLREKLRGLYLFGSLVSGDFVEGISDIDLFALLTADLNEDEFAALDKTHGALIAENPEWEDRHEIAYLAENVLATFRTQRSSIAVISPGEPFHIKEAGRDWAINWYVLRQHGRALFGPPVDEIFPEISQREFVEFVRDQALEWGDWLPHTRESARYQSYAVLTLSRALYAVSKGEQPSKRVAGEWVVACFPKWAELIAWAFAIRVTRGNEDIDTATNYPQVEAFVQFVMDEVEKAI
jgi:predicted nucleotidyltransferase